MADKILNDRQISQLKELLWKKVAAKEHVTSAQITEVNRDSQNMRVVSVKATIDGVPDQVLGGISEGAAIGVGDTVEVGRPSVQKVNPQWSFKRVVSSTLPFGASIDTNTTLPTPTGLTLVTSSYEPTPGGLLSKIQVSWNELKDSYGVDRYVVAYRTNTDTDWHESSVKHLVGQNGGVQSTLLTGLQPETTYNLKLKAVGKTGGESPWTDVSTLETSGDTAPPAVPTGLTGVAATLQNVLSWDRNTEYDFAYYNVYAATGSSADSWTLQTQAKRNGWTHTGSAYDTYYYSLEAVDNSGNASEKCDAAGPFTMGAVNVDPIESDITPPPVVSDSDFVYTTSIEKDANGNWRPFIVLSVTSGPSNYVKPSDFDHFVFKLTRTSDSTYRLYATNQSSETSVRISEWLDFGTAYTAQALGQDKTGNQSAWNSTPLSITTASPDDPPVPLVAATLSTSFKLMKVLFAWVDNDNVDYVEYQRATNSGFSTNLFTFYSNGYQSPPGGSGDFWIIDGTDAIYPLTPDTRYYYRYRFRNFGGSYSSSWSPSANAVVSQIGASDIVANSITANQIAAGTITGTEIATNTINSNNLTIGGIEANLVKNPSFEDGDVGWTIRPTYGSYSISSTYAYDGGYSLKLGAPTSIVCSRAFPVSPGTTYAVKFFARGSSADTDGLGCYIYEVATADPPASGFVTTYTTYQTVFAAGTDVTASFAEFSGTYTPTAGTTYASIAFYNWTNGPANIYIDQVDVRRRTSSVQIEDGAITADKLEANLVIANTFIAPSNPADLTKARITIDSTGIHGYNNSNQEILSLQHTTGLLYTQNVATGREITVGAGTVSFNSTAGSLAATMYPATAYGTLADCVVIAKSPDTAGDALGVDGNMYVGGLVSNPAGYMLASNTTSQRLISATPYTAVDCHVSNAASGGATLWYSAAKTWTWTAGSFASTPQVWGAASGSTDANGVMVNCTAKSSSSATFYGSSSFNERDPDFQLFALGTH